MSLEQKLKKSTSLAYWSAIPSRVEKFEDVV